MKVYIAAVVLLLISMAAAVPVHNGMVFYHMPAYYHPYQQAMLLHYQQQPFGRSAGTSAYAAGDSIAAGTLVKEHRVRLDDPSESEQQETYASDGDVQAIAEAYPEEPQITTVDETIHQRQEEIGPQVNEVIPLNDPQVPLAPLPEEAPAAISTTTTVAPKKKVHVTVDIPDASVANKESDDDDDEDSDDDYAPPKPYKPSKNDRAPQSPVYTYFPINFGKTSGGTIAIANAYNTGKGAVRSHAIAYGSSAGSSSRQRAAKRNVNTAK